MKTLLSGSTQWNKVGSWYFAADAIVTIHSDSTDKSTNADAVQLVSVISGGNGNNAPAISGVPATTVTVDTAYSFIPSANDADGDNLIFNISNPPGWASFNSSTGALTGTPAIGDEGTTQNIVISVSDGLQTTSLPAFNLTVVQENSGGVVELILDNNQPGTVATGNWLRSGGADSYGTQSLYSREIGATYRYTLPIAESGTYDVNLWWTEFYNRSTNVAIDITHRDGIARIYINQKQNGGQWNKVGSWYFDNDAIITIHSDATDKSTNADAVRLVSADPGGNTNSAPTIGGIPATAVTVDTTYLFSPNANDADGDNLTFDISNKPDWASFNSSTGALTGTPIMGDEGATQNIVISVSDGLRTTSLPAFNITVHDVLVSGSLVDPTPGERNLFGIRTVTLANGNVIISDYDDFDNLGLELLGSSHLYNPLSKTLIASFLGPRTSAYPLANNNFVIISHGIGEVGEGTEGSIRLINGDTGIQIGSSLPGSPLDELASVSLRVHKLNNGNFITTADFASENATLVRLINGFTGIQIGPTRVLRSLSFRPPLILSNSNFVVIHESRRRGHLISGLTGTQVGADVVGAEDSWGELTSIRGLTNDNFVIRWIQTDQEGNTVAGTVQLTNGFTGNQIGATLSLPGNSEDDFEESNIIALENGNFVIASPYVDSGVVQLINGTTGVQIGTTLTGETSNTSSYGSNVMPLANNNFVVVSESTVELINGFTGDRMGTALASNVGRNGNPRGITPLGNSNFVIVASFHDEEGIINAGSVRLINGATNVQIGTTLTGDIENDQLGSNGVLVLGNNNFVIVSSKDDEGGIVDAGSIRLIDGETGVQIGTTLAGDTENDQLGSSGSAGDDRRFRLSGVRALTNNNFVIVSSIDDEGGIVDAGSVRLVNGNTGMQMNLTVGNAAGEVSFASMIYLATGDFYILSLPYADNNGLENSGKVLGCRKIAIKVAIDPPSIWILGNCALTLEIIK